MNPAFQSARQAACFAAVSAIIVILPLVLKVVGPPSRQEAAKAVSSNLGPVGNFIRTVFDKKDNADIVFVGASATQRALLPAEMRPLLSRQLGHTVSVEELVMWWYNVDLEYLMLKDYLAHHKPGVVVLEIPSKMKCGTTPHRRLFRWLRYGEDRDVISTLPIGTRASIFAEEVFGATRQVLSLIRPNLISEAEETDAAFYESEHKERERNFDGSRVVPIASPATQIANEKWLLPVTTPLIRNIDLPAGHSAFVTTFLKQIASLVRLAGSDLVLLDIPDLEESSNGRNDVEQVVNLRDIFGSDANLVAVPPAKLFPNLTDRQVKFYYTDDRHLNSNGAKVFRAAIAPAIALAYQRTRELAKR